MWVSSQDNALVPQNYGSHRQKSAVVHWSPFSKISVSRFFVKGVVSIDTITKLCDIFVGAALPNCAGFPQVFLTSGIWAITRLFSGRFGEFKNHPSRAD